MTSTVQSNSSRAIMDIRQTARSVYDSLDVAVVIPCRNESASISKVVHDFSKSLPGASIYVFDNLSEDGSGEIARSAGAIVRHVSLPGKGNVVRRIFADVEADIFVLVDGDDTYAADDAPIMIQKLLTEHLDMVCGARISQEAAAFRSGHEWGNRALNGLVHAIFGRDFRDMLTGYRVMTRRFVKSFAAHSTGFETETELSVHALQMRIPTEEIQTPYKARRDGSRSKLNTVRDGIRIVRLIGLMVREEKPMQFFSIIAAILTALSFVLFIPVMIDYLTLALVPRFPTLIVSVSFAVLGVISFVCGIILDSISRFRLEQRRMAYLAVPATRII